MPIIETVVIHKSSLEFNFRQYATFSLVFLAKVVPPGEKTTFQVVFLARMRKTHFSFICHKES
eukprot:m.142878 g.142878  ORF g.142878 m.142878 type:complete len:63 (+) comp38370_c0_seq31:457-645(+)